MKIHPVTLAALALCLFAGPLRADEKPLREILRDGLYAEEVSRDPAAAAESYEAVLARYAEQRDFAAAALFRLAEVRRKQDRKADAIQLYQRLLAEFPQAENETKLARENLAALGAKFDQPATDDNAVELQRLQQWVESSPDRLKDPDLLLDAVKQGHLRSIEFLLKAGAAAPEPWRLLREAVTTGNLRTTELLLDYPFKTGYHGLDDALFTAVTLDYDDMARLLLDHGADPQRQDWFLTVQNTTPQPSTKAQMTALHVAVRKGNIALCKLLLEHKADPNAFAKEPELPKLDSSRPGPPTGTPLHDAVISNLEITRLLLEHGAKVNAAPDSTGFTPLHSAVRRNKNTEIIQLLLEKGAPLEAAISGPVEAAPDESTQPRRPRNATHSRDIPPGATPLRVALASGNQEAVQQLLAAGASAKHPGILTAAIDTLNADFVRAVLEKGALESAPPSDPLRILATKSLGDSLTAHREKILNLLLHYGAKPDPAWIDQSFEGASPDSLPLLYQHFLIPRLFEKSAVTVICPFTSGMQPLALATRESDTSPPALANLLLDAKVRWPYFRSSSSELMFPSRPILWRKGADGKAESLPFKLDGSQPLPELHWGDVLEFKPDWEKLGGRPDSVEYRDELPAELRWNLQKGISFPVTVEIDGKTREITLRGDRLVFDPSSDQIPLVGASRLAGLLAPPQFESMAEPTVHVVRTGWPDVRIPWGASATSDFALEAGDTIRVVSSPLPPERPTNFRKRQVFVTGEGSPILRLYGNSEADPFSPGDVPVSIPTLIQALVDIPGGYMASLGDAPVDPVKFPEWLTARNGLVPLSLLPHPDYSRIRIRRLLEDGSEKLIEVDLTAAIAAAGPDVTPEIARAADIVLQAGDIVEIPQRVDRSGQAWKGSSPEEAAFFSKALSCRVQVNGQNNDIALREIQYQAPRFVETSGGWIPLPPEQGVASLRASDALNLGNGEVIITRKGAGSDNQAASSVFLREGDVIQVLSRPREMVAPPRAQRQPRPKVVPPPVPPSR